MVVVVAVGGKMTLFGVSRRTGGEEGWGGSCVGVREQIKSLQIAVNRNVPGSHCQSVGLRGIDISA